MKIEVYIQKAPTAETLALALERVAEEIRSGNDTGLPHTIGGLRGFWVIEDEK